jgi:hypothetical protein
MRAVWIAVVALTAAVAIAAAGDAPSTVIFPDQRLPLRFDHATHLGDGVACVDCHRTAATSRSAVDDLLPGEDTCRSCHAIERDQPEKAATPAARCDACHVGYVAGQPVARVYIPPPNLKFDHQAHVARGQACTGCHGDLAAEQVGLATRDQLPTMRRCLDCHDGKQAPDACSTCHLTDVGRVRTDLTSGRLAPSGAIWGDDHGIDFERRHGAIASRDAGYCASCHRQSECSDCHTGVVRPEDFHPGDYVATHAIDGRRNVPDCSTCHRTESFCVACHERSGVGTRDTDFDQSDPQLRFHPDDWVSDTGANRHAREARANLKACSSCHREDDCLACHTAESGTPQISPHGAGWRGSRRCESLAAKNPRMCLRCHIDEAESGCDW